MKYGVGTKLDSDGCGVNKSADRLFFCIRTFPKARSALLRNTVHALSSGCSGRCTEHVVLMNLMPDCSSKSLTTEGHIPNAFFHGGEIRQAEKTRTPGRSGIGWLWEPVYAAACDCSPTGHKGMCFESSSGFDITTSFNARKSSAPD